MTNKYLLIEEVAAELRFDVTAPSNPVKAVRKWLTRYAVPIRKRGSRVLVERAAMEAAIERAAA